MAHMRECHEAFSIAVRVGCDVGKIKLGPRTSADSLARSESRAQKCDLLKCAKQLNRSGAVGVQSQVNQKRRRVRLAS